MCCCNLPLSEQKFNEYLCVIEICFMSRAFSSILSQVLLNIYPELAIWAFALAAFSAGVCAALLPIETRNKDMEVCNLIQPNYVIKTKTLFKHHKHQPK